MTRLRSGEDLTDALAALCDVLGGLPGCVTAESARNLDEPDLWLLMARWSDVGSYRRALSSYEVRVAMAPLMGVVIDEPSAYESAGADGDAWNVNLPR